MKINQSDFDLLNALVRGELDPVAKAELQKRLNTEPDLNATYQFLIGAKKGIRNTKLNEKLEQLKAIEAKISTSVKGETKRRIQRLYPPLAIAASILLLAAAILFLRGDSVNRQFIDEHFNHVPTNLEITRTDQNQTEGNVRVKAYNLYEVKSYEEAAPLLLSLYKDERDTLSLYYAGLAYLASYNLKKAKKCLGDPVLQNKDLETVEYLELIESARR